MSSNFHWDRYPHLASVTTQPARLRGHRPDTLTPRSSVQALHGHNGVGATDSQAFPSCCLSPASPAPPEALRGPGIPALVMGCHCPHHVCPLDPTVGEASQRLNENGNQHCVTHVHGNTHNCGTHLAQSQPELPGPRGTAVCEGPQGPPEPAKPGQLTACLASQ